MIYCSLYLIFTLDDNYSKVPSNLLDLTHTWVVFSALYCNYIVYAHLNSDIPHA